MLKSKIEIHEPIEETVLRGTGKCYCVNEQKKADLFYLNNATWDVLCEFCGKIGEGTWDNEHQRL